MTKYSRPIVCVISGGQTGVDRAALDATVNIVPGRSLFVFVANIHAAREAHQAVDNDHLAMIVGQDALILRGNPHAEQPLEAPTNARGQAGEELVVDDHFDVQLL